MRIATVRIMNVMHSAMGNLKKYNLNEFYPSLMKFYEQLKLHYFYSEDITFGVFFCIHFVNQISNFYKPCITMRLM